MERNLSIAKIIENMSSHHSSFNSTEKERIKKEIEKLLIIDKTKNKWQTGLMVIVFFTLIFSIIAMVVALTQKNL